MKLTLKDTVADMLSSSYRSQLLAEYWQTKLRYESVKARANAIEAMSFASGSGYECEPRPLTKADNCLTLLREQQACMGKYLHCLEIRAVIDGVDLSEEPKSNVYKVKKVSKAKIIFTSPYDEFEPAVREYRSLLKELKAGECLELVCADMMTGRETLIMGEGSEGDLTTMEVAELQ